MLWDISVRMGKRKGTGLILLGILCLLGAGGLYVKNELESYRAKQTSYEVLDTMMEYYVSGQDIYEPSDSENQPQLHKEDYQQIQQQFPEIYSRQMSVVELDGKEYIGYMTIPSLELILPVMSEWSYENLQIAPCRYLGEVKTDDLIICAHNYAAHFRDIGTLSAGALVTVTDMNGFVTEYEVAEVLILSAYSIDEMESGGYPLTLFTCTYGGQSRITVRCIKK